MYHTFTAELIYKTLKHAVMQTSQSVLTAGIDLCDTQVQSPRGLCPFKVTQIPL